MKKMQIIAWTAFVLGLVFKLFHWPGAAYLSLLGTLLLLIHSIIYLCKNAKTNLPMSFLHLSCSFLTIYVFFRLMFWPLGSILFIIAFLVSIVCFVLLFKNKSKFKFPQIFFIVYFVFFIALSYTNSHRIYYFFHLNEMLNSETNKTNYYAWDNYSWFLYIANKHDEALEANHKAQMAVEEYQKRPHTKKDFFYWELIKQHEQQIRDRNWTTYD